MTSSRFYLINLIFGTLHNSLSADPNFARHVVKKFQRWEPKMSEFSYRKEHVMGELNYWTDLTTRWKVGWIAGSEHKAHGKMASQLAQPYITPPDCNTVEYQPKKKILLAQKNNVQEYEKS
jgi:hypothetical protein